MGRGDEPTRLSALRVLLVQIRDKPAIERQERDCFVEYSGLDRSQFEFWNVVTEPDVLRRDASAFDAVVIGGAGAHSVTETYPWTGALASLVEELVAGGTPLFGSCWGHQFLAAALGGEVVTDLERAEVGTFAVELTDAGRADPWFEHLPPRFEVQLGHHDRVIRLPPGGVELARSESQGNQAFRVAEKLVYGAQFHVELDRARMIERARVYRDEYLGDPGALTRLMESLRETPLAPQLLARFFALVAERAGGLSPGRAQV